MKTSFTIVGAATVVAGAMLTHGAPVDVARMPAHGVVATPNVVSASGALSSGDENRLVARFDRAEALEDLGESTLDALSHGTESSFSGREVSGASTSQAAVEGHNTFSSSPRSGETISHSIVDLDEHEKRVLETETAQSIWQEKVEELSRLEAEAPAARSRIQQRRNELSEPTKKKSFIERLVSVARKPPAKVADEDHTTQVREKLEQLSIEELRLDSAIATKTHEVHTAMVNVQEAIRQEYHAHRNKYRPGEAHKMRTFRSRYYK